MARRLGMIVAALQLARIGLVTTAVSNIWTVAWLGREQAGGSSLETWALLATTAAVAVGMYVFGMTLNDLLDARRDRVLAPDRPLPSRRIRPGTATALAVAALLVSIAGSIPLGTVPTLLGIVTATMVLFYNGPGKHIAGLGLLTLGFIRAAHMLIAAPSLHYLWPVWLTLTHVIGLSALCHRLEEKRPPLVGPQVWVVTLGWAFASVAMIGWMMQNGGMTMPDRPWVWAGPGAAAGAFLLVVGFTIHGADTPRMAGGLLMKRGLMWLMVYDVAWLAGAGLWKPAAVNATLLPATWLLMAFVRRLKTLGEGPVVFQR